MKVRYDDDRYSDEFAWLECPRREEHVRYALTHGTLQDHKRDPVRATAVTIGTIVEGFCPACPEFRLEPVPGQPSRCPCCRAAWSVYGDRFYVWPGELRGVTR